MLNSKEPDPFLNVNQNVINYKGIYYDDEPEQKYFEGGAHFSHFNLCYKLEEIILTLSPERRGNSIYDTPNLSNIISDSNTKAETRKIASDNSKEMIKNEKSLSKKPNDIDRNNANYKLINNNSVSKNKIPLLINKSNKPTYKKIQPKNLMYNNSLKISDNVSSMKLHVKTESSATKLYSKANKCIIDLNLNMKKSILNKTLKTQKSTSICCSSKSNNNDVLYNLAKNKTSSKIFNFNLNRKINIITQTSNNTISNINTTSNVDDSSKNKEKDKKKIINTFNSILNITNNKSRNQQPKKNSLENKTSENVHIKIFTTNQPPKLDTIKRKEIKYDYNINSKMASRNKTSKKKFEEKSHTIKTVELIKIKPLKCLEIRKELNISKPKIFKKIKTIDNFENTKINKSLIKNSMITSKKIDPNINTKNNFSSIIKISKEKSENKLISNFLNFSKNLPVSKKH